MRKKEKVFVYGTLRKGFPLHKHLARSEVKFLGRGTIQGTLYDLGDYPGVIRSNKGEVKGELYELLDGQEQLKKLDELEEFDPNRPKESLFVRSLSNVRLGPGKMMRAWVYFLPSKPAKGHVIRSGNYTSKNLSRISG